MADDQDMKRQQPTVFSRILLDRLWEQCNWAHEVWTLRRALIDRNRRKKALENGPHSAFISAAGMALHDYALLQIAKLHDSATVAGRVCLTLDYIVEYGGWDESTERRLRSLKTRLDAFQAKIRPARNRLISHSDLATILNGQALGGFDAGDDQKYFKTLSLFVSTAFQSAVGGPCAAFSTLTDDTERAVATLAKSTIRTRRRRPAGR